MEPQNNTAVVSTRPQFFKVLFPDPFANLMIPQKFHMNLPHKLHSFATLFSPTGKFWHVKIHRTGKDVYFHNGWPEFAKAHDLQTGYFLVFRYEGNMIFKIKIFDTTGCLKDYSPPSHAQHSSVYAEIRESSETEEPSKRSQSILKRRKFANNQALEFDKSEKGSTSQKTLLKKKKIGRNHNNTMCSFEKILKPYCFSEGFLSIPKSFCVNNGLLTTCTIYLKRDSSEETSWPVQFCLRASHGDLGKGWKEFRDAAAFKEGDRCIFQLISENFLVVTVIPQESDSAKERKRKDMEGSTLPVVEKQLQQIKQYSRPILEWESTVRQYHISQSYQSLGRVFCLDNKLTSTRDLTLRDLTGKEWNVQFYIHATEGRLSRRGWTEFSSEYGLKTGDKCIFKIIGKDTLLVRVVKK